MKSQIFFSTLCAVILFVFASNSFAQTTTTVITTPTKKYVVTKEAFPQWSVTPSGGIVFPIMDLSNSFKSNGIFGLEVGTKVNKEVGFYLRGNYMFMNSSASGAPVGKYIEISVGPRYYFSSINVKSQLFADAGLGPYIFTQASYQPQDPTAAVIPEISETKLGVNAGVGASLYLSDNMNLMIRTKYNTVFTSTATKSFITASTGLEFKF